MPSNRWHILWLTAKRVRVRERARERDGARPAERQELFEFSGNCFLLWFQVLFLPPSTASEHFLSQCCMNVNRFSRTHCPIRLKPSKQKILKATQMRNDQFSPVQIVNNIQELSFRFNFCCCYFVSLLDFALFVSGFIPFLPLLSSQLQFTFNKWRYSTYWHDWNAECFFFRVQKTSFIYTGNWDVVVDDVDGASIKRSKILSLYLAHRPRKRCRKTSAHTKCVAN